MQMIDEMKNSIKSSINHKMNKQKDFLKLLFNQLKSFNPKNKINQRKNEMILFSKRLDQIMKNILDLKKERTTKLLSHLKSIDPKNLLSKGYSILFLEKDSSIILSKDDAKENDRISALVSDGKIYAKIERKK